MPSTYEPFHEDVTVSRKRSWSSSHRAPVPSPIRCTTSRVTRVVGPSRSNRSHRNVQDGSVEVEVEGLMTNGIQPIDEMVVEVLVGGMPVRLRTPSRSQPLPHLPYLIPLRLHLHHRSPENICDVFWDSLLWLWDAKTIRMGDPIHAAQTTQAAPRSAADVRLAGKESSAAGAAAPCHAAVP